MQNWNTVRPIAVQILQNQRYKNSGNYDTACFLTAYQIAVLVDKKDSALKGTLPIGGEGVGSDSFTRQIAWHLSDDINKDIFKGDLEIQFLNLSGLDEFTFGGGYTPSANAFSMFRFKKRFKPANPCSVEENGVFW